MGSENILSLIVHTVIDDLTPLILPILFRTTSLNLTAGRFYDITVLHIAGLSNHREVELSFVKPNGSSEGPISEENIVAYQNGTLLIF